MNLLGKLTLLSMMTLSLVVAPIAIQVSAAGESTPTTENGQDGKQQERPHKHGQHRPILGGHVVKETADLLGIKPQILVEELRQGKTLLEVVQVSKGWTEEQYLQKLTESVQPYIVKAQSEGKLSAETATRMKEHLPVRLKQIINRTWNQSPPGHPALDYKHNQIKWSQLQQN